MEYDGIGGDPDPQALSALRKHSDLLKQLYASLEEATEEARSIFRKEGYPADGHYFSHTVRYGLLRRLLDPELRSRLGLEVFQLAMTGIELRRGSDRFKIWKAAEAEKIPPTGASEGRKEYVSQAQMPLFPEHAQSPQRIAGNSAKLLVLWDVDESLSLNLVKLVCPMGWETEWAPGTEHWSLTVPHPANWIEPTEDFGADETPDDLDIDLDEPEVGGDE